MKRLNLIAITLLLSLTVLLAQEKQEKIGDSPQLKKVSKQAVGDQTSGAIQLNSTTAVTYDFTQPGAAYTTGPDPMVEVEPGIWALIAGDADGNGAIDAVDKNDFWRVENGTTYDYTKNSDFNLDGNLDAVDKNDYWRVNNGKATQVP